MAKKKQTKPGAPPGGHPDYTDIAFPPAVGDAAKKVGEGIADGAVEFGKAVGNTANKAAKAIKGLFK